MSYQIVIAGVGGQGVVTLTEIVGQASILSGLKVNGAETHGMAQRGGSVVSHLRIGQSSMAPLITDGMADAILALEPSEALRHAKLLKSDGVIIYSTDVITPSSITIQHKEYPPITPIYNKLTKIAKFVFPIQSNVLLERGIPIKSLNIAILGGLSGFWEYNNFIPIISNDKFLEVISKRWPKNFDINKKAFEFGQHSILNLNISQ
ncbi:MAG: indolepyruvate oxidoreductase subunit beta [Candidatus Thorarchaeota archaeon]